MVVAYNQSFQVKMNSLSLKNESFWGLEKLSKLHEIWDEKYVISNF